MSSPRGHKEEWHVELPDLPQPEWGFVSQLESPLHERPPFHWQRRAACADEVSLCGGAHLDERFPDPDSLLDTAYADFRQFLRVGGIGGGAYAITCMPASFSVPEAYTVDVGADECRILAGDTEGIRRGLVFVENLMLRSGGPLLPLGTIVREPVIRTRISRCFFGPINRPPANRDELADDVDYYPDEYLNRLAHEGVNGLWLTITFRDTVPSKIIPEYGRNSASRLAKLRATVDKCLRYGIRIYVFCIEPAALTADSPVLAAHPELGGCRRGNHVAFCTSSPTGLAYLEEATFNLFSAVPGLGGLIDISVGERFTHCYSSRSGPDVPNNCPRCSKRQPWEVLADTVAAMAKGMHAVDPRAELVSWPYSQYQGWGEELTTAAAAQVPPGVILMHNFESRGRRLQLGRWRPAEDYWLSYVGPSELYRACARAAVGQGTRMFAKLQVGNSHEVATVPHVPVPGNLYRKYAAMHALGVSGAMQCWYFGNYPSLMTGAAGELSFKPFPQSEDEFLLQLAQRDWGENAATVAEAWRLFSEAYENYPLSAAFSYYGPMHDGPAWPLFLEPVYLPLAHTWKIVFKQSGDRVGECIMWTHTWEEILILTERMARIWEQGVALLRSLEPLYSDSPEHLLDIGVARALGLQFRSGWHILQFYALREELAEWRKGPDGPVLLERLANLVHRELEVDGELLALAEADSRLGFHSEAEGYKYFPAKIRARMDQLRDLLETEFPRIRARVEKGQVPFPRHTGEEPVGRICQGVRVTTPPALNGRLEGPIWQQAPASSGFTTVSNGEVDATTSWRAVYDDEAVYFGFRCQKVDGQTGDSMELRIESRRLWPPDAMIFGPGGRCEQVRLYLDTRDPLDWQVSTADGTDAWTAVVRIAWDSLWAVRHQKALRVNVIRRGARHSRWVVLPPVPARLIYGSDNPAEYGWLTLG
jgi:hypothetical protein